MIHYCTYFDHNYAVRAIAICSLRASVPGAQLLLCGQESGTAEVVSDLGLEHVPDIKRSPLGALLLNDVFRQAHSCARHGTLCFVNADIVFRGDVGTVIGLPSLLGGKSFDVDVREPLECTAT